MKFLLALLVFSCVTQTTTSQSGDVVPQAFPATHVGGSGQGCPTEEEWAAARNEVLQEVYAQIMEQFGVTPSPLPGERADFPASSCQQIAELSPDSPPGNYWIIAPNGSAVLVYCNMNGSTATSAMATSTTTLDQSTITSLQPTPTVTPDTAQELTPIFQQATPTVTPDTAEELTPIFQQATPTVTPDTAQELTQIYQQPTPTVTTQELTPIFQQATPTVTPSDTAEELTPILQPTPLEG